MYVIELDNVLRCFFFNGLTCHSFVRVTDLLDGFRFGFFGSLVNIRKVV